MKSLRLIHDPKRLHRNLSRRDGTACAGTTLSRAQVQLTTLNSLRLLNDLLTLSQDHLDVARVRHVGVDLESMLEPIPRPFATRWYLRGRAHGMCVCAASAPG